MRKGKLIKGLCYTLISSLILGNISPVLAKTSVASVDETIDIKESGSSETSVYAELGSEFLVTIPKSLTLSGLSKTGTYTVSVEGDIAGYEKINIIPDETFTLNSQGLNGITASISQDKTSWLFNEILESNKIIGNGEISANLTAGKWEGSFNFNINLGGLISVDAKDKSGNNLNARASEITGTEKETLLTSLEETGMITSKDEVNALIEVESDEFDGIADTTFDVSSIANKGDKVAILHFDETKQEWEYIGTETVDANGLISGNFTSYSPVAFVKITNNGNFENIKIPGLYDANGNLLCTWAKSGINVTANYTGSNYNTTTTSGYYILTNKYPTTTKVVLPEGITKIGDWTFARCENLTSVTIPDGVTSIGEFAFGQSKKLSYINIPDGVTSLGGYSLYFCQGLTSIVLPDIIKNIGANTFTACTYLKTINYTGTQTQWNAISKGSYWKDQCPATVVCNYKQ